MSLEDICNKITKDAEAEAERIENESRLETERKLSDKDQELAEELAVVQEESVQKIARLKEQADFRLRVIEKNAVLLAKQESVNSVFAAAQDRLAKAGDDEFVRVFSRALKSAPVLEEAKAVFSGKRKHLAKKVLAAAGVKYPVSESQLPEGQEGLILSSDNVELNITADVLLDGLREELTGELALILFGNDK